MKAAVIRGMGQTSAYGDFPEPAASADECRITVTAAALTQVTKSRASGAHYSSSGKFPFVVGIDGVGRLDDGRSVYFLLPRAPYGGMAEQTVVPSAHCVAIPDNLDDVTAAAIANPGLSSWAAVQIAKHLGARKVIATGRNRERLRSAAALGANITILLGEDDEALEEGFKEQFADGVDVVIDYLWGKSAERLLIAGAKAGAEAVPIRFVQVGSVSGPDVTLPSAVLRSSAIELMGSGIGSIPKERFVNAVGSLLHAAAPTGLTIATKTVPLSDVEQAWDGNDSTRRTVFTIGA